MIKYNAIQLKDINAEYSIDWDDVFNEDSDRYRKLIKILETELTTAERIIILISAELNSSKKVGDVLGVSQSTAYNELKRIKNKIKECL
jgi:DNA-directed RNA polymerase specialized sigma subunit